MDKMNISLFAKNFVNHIFKHSNRKFSIYLFDIINNWMRWDQCSSLVVIIQKAAHIIYYAIDNGFDFENVLLHIVLFSCLLNRLEEENNFRFINIHTTHRQDVYIIHLWDYNEFSSFWYRHHMVLFFSSYSPSETRKLKWK